MLIRWLRKLVAIEAVKCLHPVKGDVLVFEMQSPWRDKKLPGSALEHCYQGLRHAFPDQKIVLLADGIRFRGLAQWEKEHGKD